FFFSSRRRHTRSKRDWSSDVCSSDLTIWTIAISPDGRLLAAAGGDYPFNDRKCAPGTIALWDTKTRKQVATLRGHESFIYSIILDRKSVRVGKECKSWW